VKIKIPRANKFVYGKLRGSLKKPLIIFVPGLFCSINEHYFFNGAKYFAKHGYSVFRMNLYDHHKDARKAAACTLTTHAGDLDVVVDYFREKKVRQIFVVGHSNGGAVVLLSKNKNFDGVVLWDPAHEKRSGYKKYSYVTRLPGSKHYRMRWAIDYILPKNLVEEAETISYENLIKDIHAPIKIIVAEKGVLVPYGKRYFKKANDPKDFHVLKNSGHTFDEDGAEDRLFKETRKWFDRFSK